MTSKVTPEVTKVGPKIRLEMTLFPLSGAAPKIKKNHRRPKISWSGPKEVGKPVGGPRRAFRCPIMPHIGRFLYIPIKKVRFGTLRLSSTVRDFDLRSTPLRQPTFCPPCGSVARSTLPTLAPGPLQGPKQRRLDLREMPLLSSSKWQRGGSRPPPPQNLKNRTWRGE